jgi:hypothetical protein
MAAERGVYVGNDKSDLLQFDGFIGHPAETVLVYTGGRNWADMDPAWQFTGNYLGTSGHDLNWSLRMVPDDGGVQAYRDAAAGKFHDTYVGWAKTILAHDDGSDPIYVRFAHELGGDWFPWTQAAKQDPAAFKAAWEDITEAFRGVSDRFKIVFDTASDREFDPEFFYPGDHVVDVIARDIYANPQWSSYDVNKAWQWYTHDMPNGLQDLADFAGKHGKPMAIPEWGVPGSANAALHDGYRISGEFDSAAFIEKMEDWIEGHDVRFANYWNTTELYDGLLSDGDPAAAAAALNAFYG